MLKRIAIKMLSLIITIITLSIIYNNFFYEKDLQKHSEIINDIRDIPVETDIIYIGESSNITFREDDLDRRSISNFIGDYFPELIVSDITKPASHAGIFKVLLENIPEDNNAKTIIVTLNLRSFNAQWRYSRAETSLQKSIMLLKPYPPIVNRFLLSFKAYDIKTDKERKEQYRERWKNDTLKLPPNSPYKNVIEWDIWKSKKGIRFEDGSKNYPQTQLACNFIKTYGFHIDTCNHPRLKDFNDIINLAENRGWKVIFLLLAENTEKAALLVGDELVEIINDNAKLLYQYYTKKGITVVNNINLVEDDQFIDQDWTTEHYAEKGRKIIASNAAKALQQYYPGYYIDMHYESYYRFFFNDCDNGVKWGQYQTITDEESFSGEYSSLTGNGSKYSITFERSLKDLPDSLCSTLNINLKILQKSLEHNGVLVIQTAGKNSNNFWKGIPIKDYVNEVDEWITLETSINIPDSIKNAEKLKVYVFNNSNVELYVDDFKIWFE